MTSLPEEQVSTGLACPQALFCMAHFPHTTLAHTCLQQTELKPAFKQCYGYMVVEGVMLVGGDNSRVCFRASAHLFCWRRLVQGVSCVQ